MEHHAIKNLANGSTCHIVGENMLHEAFGLRSGDKHLAHVAHVEHATSGANCDVFVSDVGILEWHHKATEWNHLGTQAHVTVIKTCFLIFHRYNL